MGVEERLREPKSGTTLPLSKGTKRDLERLKLSDGEESWDHLLRRAASALQAVHDHPELSRQEAPA